MAARVDARADMSSGTCQARSNIIPTLPLPVEGCQFADESRDRRQTTARAVTCWHWHWPRCSRALHVGPLLTAAASCTHTEYAVQNCGQWPGQSAVKSGRAGSLAMNVGTAIFSRKKLARVVVCLGEFLVYCIHGTYQLVFRHLHVLKSHSPSSLLSRGFREKDHQPTILPVTVLCCCLWR